VLVRSYRSDSRFMFDKTPPTSPYQRKLPLSRTDWHYVGHYQQQAQ
jgi:hypothetical protein